MIIARIIALLIGYAFGLFQSGYLYGKAHGIDIREHGSGNTGTTNTLRTLGWKAGVITFLGDCFKGVLAILIIWLIYHQRYPDSVSILMFYAGLGAVFGHNFPFFMKFQGGKGIATTAGVALAICPQVAPVCIIVFVATVLVTRYVSLASILMVLAFLIQVLVFNYFGWLMLPQTAVLEFDILTVVFSVMAVVRHHANIKRLINGTENRFGKKKEEK